MSEPRQGTYRYLILLFVLCAGTTALAAVIFERTIRREGIDVWSVALMSLFVMLYFWITIGFWTATFGFIRRVVTSLKFAKQKETPGDPPFPQTAVIMPIYNEDAVSVFSRLQAMAESMMRTGRQAAFDFFVLSDTTDPDIWLEEEARWAALKAMLHGRCGLFYRRRTVNTGHKSGNIRDFCIHWGSRYQYMIVLDADSQMAGPTILEMVRRMEADPQIGILQSLPVPVNRTTLFGRLQQFAAHMYGPIFTSGYALWSQMQGTYWGHNAIIRVRPFMDSCGLPRFPGRAPLGGEILSHDFVEAALIIRRGWKVIVAHDLRDSYEECPSNLIDFARRDQRWCQGNLQHLRLLLPQDLRAVSRAQFGMGAMSYLASPLWAAFLVLVVLAGFGMRRSNAAVAGSLTALILFLCTMLLLLLPKVWALLTALVSPARITGFAGPGKAALSVFLEIVFSVLMAPILMVFHTSFVITALCGRSVQWQTQPRTDQEVPLKDAFRAHALHTIVGLSGTLLVTWLAPDMLLWMSPILLPLVLSVPLSALLGSRHVGSWLFRRHLLIIPQETRPPDLLRRQQFILRTCTESVRKIPHPFIRLVIDPAFNALHIALLPRRRSPADPQRMIRLRSVALSGGPAHLSKSERGEILADADALRWLHRRAWTDWPLDLIQRCRKALTLL